MAAAITGTDPVWDIEAGTFARSIFNQLAFFAMAFAFGPVFLSTPAAIAVYYVVAMLVPFMVYGTLYAFFDWAKDLIPWIDLGFAISPYPGQSPDAAEPSTTTLLQVIFTFAIWVVLPFVLGLRRVTRAELK
ncbi:hypothetical protein [Nocardioides sp. B-3]|uniref:hypothetical protein n=1 Tax=Nocardioides sp. B-3 TaxID=2895565 RepID=UPI002152091F|nr:hypothetical protein [Nocardioides sp. B-3]UUZ60081.1 hypothetical protein LP418_03615 [Nocardioides sp. B-3]